MGMNTLWTASPARRRAWRPTGPRAACCGAAAGDLLGGWAGKATEGGADDATGARPAFRPPAFGPRAAPVPAAVAAAAERKRRRGPTPKLPRAARRGSWNRWPCDGRAAAPRRPSEPARAGPHQGPRRRRHVDLGQEQGGNRGRRREENQPFGPHEPSPHPQREDAQKGGASQCPQRLSMDDRQTDAGLAGQVDPIGRPSQRVGGAVARQVDHRPRHARLGRCLHPRGDGHERGIVAPLGGLQQPVGQRSGEHAPGGFVAGRHEGGAVEGRVGAAGQEHDVAQAEQGQVGLLEQDDCPALALHARRRRRDPALSGEPDPSQRPAVHQ